ncbi:MAG: ATP-dependent DNA ligase, partial [Candidatus Pacearchaeota archaeon]
ATTKRLEKIAILAKFLKNIEEKDKDILYLLLGNIYPDYNKKKIGVSTKLTIKAISKATGIEEDKVLHEWKKIGDLGNVAESLISRKKQTTLNTSPLTTKEVIENLRKLTDLEGKGTVEKKLLIIVELLSSATPREALYLIRTLLSELRIGIKESTIRDAITETFFSPNEKMEALKKIQEAMDNSNDIAYVFEIAKKGQLQNLKKAEIEVGKPLKVMLAQKAENIQEAFKKVGKPCAIEYKYDGFRMLIHKKGNKIFLFTRRLEDVTKQFPEVVDYVKEYVSGNSFIIDSEAVGFNNETKEYRPFQEISQRIKRKYKIEKMQKELPVEINVFDLLYYNGKSLLKEPFEKRSALLRKIVKEAPYKIVHSKQLITSDEKSAEKFFKSALKDNQEGIMFKNLKAIYQPGSRVGHMLKVKPTQEELDLVITGAEYGTGKRSGWLSSFILSCKDEKTGKFLDVGKMGTGIKEKEREGISFKELTNKLKPLIIEEQGKMVKIKPKIVISVTYQEIQKSPTYSSGFALRFPKFKSIRPDKSQDDASTLEEIKEHFERQKIVGSTSKYKSHF